MKTSIIITIIILITMGSKIAELGWNAANAATSGIFGIALGGINDKRQIKQQKKLQALEMEGQRQMTDYNMMKQLEMWEKTGYEAQRRQMEDAGLNPGLLYGMGGGGGQSSNIETGKVTGGQAPTGGGEIMQMQQMGIQKELLQAQKDNIIANTEKTKAETGNVPKTGENIESSTALNKLNKEIGEYEKQIKGRSIEATIRGIDAAAEKLMHEAVILRNQEYVSEATWETDVKLKMAELITVGIQNNQTEQLTKESKQKVTNMVQELINKSRELNQKDLEIAIKTFEANLKQEMPGVGQAIGRLVNGAINEYLHWTKGILGNKEEQKPIKK